MEKNEMISVIIPTYNPDKYIEKCLDSLSRQTLQHDQFEVVVVLNGCKEPYFSMLNDILAGMSFRSSVVYTEIKGVSNARNVGLRKACGRYICFMDDDDWVSETFLESLANSMDCDRCMVVSNVKDYDEYKNLFIEGYLAKAFCRNKGKKYISFFSGRSFFSTVWCKLIDRQIIGNAEFDPDFRLGEDSLFMFQISKNVNTIKLTSSEAIYYRRLRKESASRSKKSYSENLKNICSLLNAFISIYISNIFSYSFLLFVSRIVATCIKLWK